MTRKQFLISATIIVVLSIDAHSQTPDERLELGVQYTSLQISVLDSRESGIGGRMGVRINRFLTAEGEFNFFPETELGNSGFEQRSQGLIGVKSGYSNGRLGLFAKFRPGFVQFPSLKLPGGLCHASGDTLVCSRTGRTGYKPAFDVGAVVEFYPAANYVIRLDAGDTMIKFKDDTFFTFPDPTRVRNGFSHNLQITAGFGVRF